MKKQQEQSNDEFVGLETIKQAKQETDDAIPADFGY